MGMKPEHLLHVNLRLPFEDGYVPVSMFDREFLKVEPIIQMAQHVGSVALTIGESFGFMAYGYEGQIDKTQKTDALVFAAGATMWSATVETEHPLKDIDQKLFLRGAQYYLNFAQRRLP